MDIFLLIILAVFGILQIILFFKIWEMTTNVADIKGMLSKELVGHNNETDDDSQTKDTCGYGIGELVVDLNTGNQMRIQDIKGNRYNCTRGGQYVGIFSTEEIMPFDVWVKQNAKSL